MKNMDLFKKRILGLVSYFPDIEFLLPRFEKETDLEIIKIPMSDYQFGVYEEARVQERKVEKNNAKKKAQANEVNQIYEDSVSTYRVFSRACCNFVFPRAHMKYLTASMEIASGHHSMQHVLNNLLLLMPQTP